MGVLPIAFIVYKMTKSDEENIYNAIRRFYSNASKFPTDDTGLFQGFPGVTKKVCEYIIATLKNNYAGGWFTSGFKDEYINPIVDAIVTETGADRAGVRRFCSHVFVAAQGDKDIFNYIAGGSYSGLDDLNKQIREGVSSAADTVRENIEYMASVETPIGSFFSSFGNVLPLFGFALAGYAIYKILK